MAKCKILMQTAQVQKLVTFFDGYKDDKVELKYVSKAGIKATFECETELSPEDAASHCKSLFKKTPEVICTSQSSLMDSLDKSNFMAQVKSCAFF